MAPIVVPAMDDIPVEQRAILVYESFPGPGWLLVRPADGKVVNLSNKYPDPIVEPVKMEHFSVLIVDSKSRAVNTRSRYTQRLFASSRSYQASGSLLEICERHEFFKIVICILWC